MRALKDSVRLEKFGGGTSEERSTSRSFTSSCQTARAVRGAGRSSEAGMVTAVTAAEIPQLLINTYNHTHPAKNTQHMDSMHTLIGKNTHINMKRNTRTYKHSHISTPICTNIYTHSCAFAQKHMHIHKNTHLHKRIQKTANIWCITHTCI